jgi:predicted sugar kinase
VVEFLRRQGVRGVGQSSWGPTVFAVLEDQDRADDLVGKLGRNLGLSLDRVYVTRAHNEGAVIELRSPGCDSNAIEEGSPGNPREERGELAT